MQARRQLRRRILRVRDRLRASRGPATSHGRRCASAILASARAPASPAAASGARLASWLVSREVSTRSGSKKYHSPRGLLVGRIVGQASRLPKVNSSDLHGRLQTRPTHVLGHHRAEERVRGDVVDRHRNDLADQPRVAVEDDDPVAGRAAGELDDVAARLRRRCFARSLGPSTSTSTRWPRNRWLSSSLIRFCSSSSSLLRRFFTSCGHVVGKAAPPPWCRAARCT